MAYETQIGGNGTLFVGEDKIFRFEAVDESGNPVDMTGWSMIFDVRKKDNSRDPAILGLTNFTLIGIFNSVRALNTQRALLSVIDDQMNLFKAKNYRWSWKRLDADVETVLGWGTFAPEKATAE